MASPIAPAAPLVPEAMLAGNDASIGATILPPPAGMKWFMLIACYRALILNQFHSTH